MRKTTKATDSNATQLAESPTPLVGQITNLSTGPSPLPATPDVPAGCPSPGEFLTKREMAARLKVSLRTIENWQLGSLIPHLKIGNTVRFYWPAIVAQLHKNFKGQPSGAMRARWNARKESVHRSGR